ncbi:BspA family leucine-rich repeat surface protein [Arenicellales bacterium nBUS_45]
MTLLIRLLSVLVISTSLFVAGCSSGGSSAGFDKEDTDGDGIADIYDPDIDGDGIPNGQDPDIDGDGIPNDQDPDMDGDGKPNGKDPDPENNDPNYCDRIQVFGLSEEQTTGSEIELTWEFWSSKVGSNGECTLKDGVKAGLVRFTASAAGAIKTRSGETNPLDNDEVTIKIPAACTGETVEVTYDFTEFATLIKADPNAPGWTVKQRHKANDERCDIDGDGFPDFNFGPGVCSFGNEDIKAAVNDYTEGGGNGNYKEGSKYANCGLIGTWDVSAVTYMYDLFYATPKPFNEDISGWDVSNVTSMRAMFFQADFNQNISKWDLSNVWDMQEMFKGSKFNNGGEPLNWDVSNVTKMKLMFSWAGKFNQDISGWDVSNVTNMTLMFEGAQAFANQDISSWCVSKIGNKPEGFDKSNPGFAEERQPNWGTCGTSHASDETDTDNDGIPNDSDPDVDGDGIPNTSDNDIDGDGIWNKDDPDIDGDGKTNGIDPDADGDGTPDAEDDTPGGPQ